ncbi:MAG: helix-turn-helix transcriptional regulator [Desulfobacteraceae bacterium]|jgi:PadR family transcriptional regulator, regulatory protein PadR
MSRKTKSPRRSGSKKKERYIQPSILLALRQKPSYGYELIQQIPQFGFIKGQAPPGMIYRHLRDLEDNGLVLSEWETEGSGPAKRVYQITAEGLAVLEFWIDYMKDQTERLQNFIKMYQAASDGKQ